MGISIFAFVMQRKVIAYIEREHLFSLRDKILVTLSGGADSVALLLILHSLGYECEAAHCNFQLRGDESLHDESFVIHLCERLEIPLHIIRFDTLEYAKAMKISVEMAARELRYQWFEEQRKAIKADVIAVAHHRDDSVETLLLNLIRGTGIDGLTGIPPRNGLIVRPLLCLTRKDVTGYLHRMEQPYVTDSTNLHDEYIRNKIRLNLLPAMESINPSVKEGIAATAARLGDVARIYNEEIAKGMQRVMEEKGIRISELLKESAPEALLFEILHPLGFNSSQTENIYLSLKGQSGKLFESKEGWRVIKDRELLLMEQKTKEVFPPFRLLREEKEYNEKFIIPKGKDTACLDADKLQKKLSLRKWRHGDLFVPFGMKGKKLLSNYMTDRKFSIPEKENQWVLCSGEEIVWLIGERTDNRFRVDKTTKRVVLLKIDRQVQVGSLILSGN